MAVWMHWPPGLLQASVVHGLLSLQDLALPGLQLPFEHVSPTVQASLSEHEPFTFGFLQPCCGSQVSLVQTLPSLHLAVEGVPEQVPPEQVSLTVQGTKSSQAPGVGCFTQVPPEHFPVLHASFSPLQFFGAPGLQLPPEQVSPSVHASPSEQAPGVGCFAQVPPEHTPVLQASLSPLQFFATPA